MRVEVQAFVRRMVILIAAAVVLLSVTVYIIVSRTLQPLNRVGRAVSLAAGGDLTGDPEADGRDEIGRLAGDVRLMIGSIADLVQDIDAQAAESGRAEKELFENSSLIISSAREAGNGTREIRSRISGLKTGIDEEGRAAESINAEADALAQVILRTDDTVGAATAQVDSLVSGVQDIGTRAEGSITLTDSLRRAVYDGTRRITRVGEAVGEVLGRLGEIRELASMIGDLGDRTNLLAMNASIEAAHAGDSGRGFAVVAGEIRKLAEQTGKQVSGIDQVILGVTDAIAATETTSREASEAIQTINQIADEMGAFLGEITERVSRLDGESRKIRQETESLRRDSQQTIDGSRKMIDESRNLNRSVEMITATAEELTRFSAEVENRLSENEGTIEQMENLVQRLHQSMTRLSEGIRRFTL